jgi:hypothetical protein
MRTALPTLAAPPELACHYWSGDVLRSRSIGGMVLTSRVDVPAPPAALWADWQRETTHRLCLQPGDVEALPLARARRRWPDYARCVQAVADWLQSLGLQGLPADCDVALMACRGAPYHHDAAQYGGMAFCNLFLSEDCGQEVHFPGTGQRIALARGTVLIFDTAQPHAVMARQQNGFAMGSAVQPDDLQVFLTWELHLEHKGLAQALGLRFDTDPATALRLDAEQVCLNGAPARVCPQTGLWQAAD